jgi:2-keto-3-deoxy-galactonokinase
VISLPGKFAVSVVPGIPKRHAPQAPKVAPGERSGLIGKVLSMPGKLVVVPN